MPCRRYTRCAHWRVDRRARSGPWGIVVALNVTILDSSITRRVRAAPVHLPGLLARAPRVVLSWFAGGAACRDTTTTTAAAGEAERRPFISSSGARLFDDTTAGSGRAYWRTQHSSSFFAFLSFPPFVPSLLISFHPAMNLEDRCKDPYCILEEPDRQTYFGRLRLKSKWPILQKQFWLSFTTVT